jgi:hypothetical protein
MVEFFRLYLDGGGTPISRAQAEQRMFAKLAAPRFLTDIRPLLAPEEATKLTDEAIRSAFTIVFERVISTTPGARWAKTVVTCPAKVYQPALEILALDDRLVA